MAAEMRRLRPSIVVGGLSANFKNIQTEKTV